MTPGVLHPMVVAAAASARCRGKRQQQTCDDDGGRHHQWSDSQSIHDPDSTGATTGFFCTGGGGAGHRGCGVLTGGGTGVGVDRRRRRRDWRWRAARWERLDGRRRSRSRGGRHAELALQGGQFAVADVDQSMRLGELTFQILDAILERLRFRVGCTGIAAAGRAAAGARGNETQVTIAGSAARAAPLAHLAVNFLGRFGLILRSDFVPAGDAQHRAAPQNIDIPAERIGIRAVHRHHGLIDTRGGIAVQAARDLGERVALGHLITVAGDRRCASAGLRQTGLRQTGRQERGC
jgi:hypothetical protein